MAPSTLLLVSSLITAAIAQTSGWTKTGCYKDAGTARPLTISVVPSTTSDTTVENCQAACQAKNYPYAGVENGYQCWCDVAIAPAAASQADSYCNVACFGISTEMCGGYNAMGISHNGAIIPVITVTATTTVGSKPSTTTRPSVTFSTITLTATIAPPPATTPPRLTITSPTRPTRTTSTRRPSPTTSECDGWLCCILYPENCDDSRRGGGNALPTAAAKRDDSWSTHSEWDWETKSHTKWSMTGSWPGHSSHTKQYSTSTIYATSTITITSCSAAVSCPGHTTTTIVSIGQTTCEVTPTFKPTITAPTPAPASGTSTSVGPSTSTTIKVSPLPIPSSSISLGLGVTPTSAVASPSRVSSIASAASSARPTATPTPLQVSSASRFSVTWISALIGVVVAVL